MGGAIDVGSAFSADGRQPPTYQTRSSQSAIDRALCSQSLLPMVKSLQICHHAGTGPHSPIVVTIDPGAFTKPPILKEVLPINADKVALDEPSVVEWLAKHTDNID
eukprot:3811557-Amphidinium_carterae.1